jgi:2-(1,2-epoxy-1,2-dihydrophenyl)acetyl-CoA isomerase
MFTTLDLQVRESVAHLTLNRPGAMNTANLEMGRELLQAALQCENDPKVRAVVITGAGRAFCAGGDLRGMHTQGDRSGAYLHELTTHFHAAISVFTRMNAPVVAAVNGATAGAGIGLAIMADLTLAAKSATFTLAYTAAGLTPDAGATFLLPRLIGFKRTAELLLLNRKLTAEEAFAWGMVNAVFPDEELPKEAATLAERLASGPVQAFGTVKRLLARSAGALEAQMIEEGRAIAQHVSNPEGREGIAAFMEKRKPDYLR